LSNREMDFAKVINQGLTKASHQYTEALQNTEFAKANLRFAPIVPVLDIFTPDGFSSNFGLEKMVKRMTSEMAKNKSEEDEMETEYDFDYSMHSTCFKCGTDFAPYFTQQKIGDKVELLCRDCHIRWLKDQDRDRINKLQSEMLQKVAQYIETSEVREGEIMATKERVSERNSRVQNCSQQLSKRNVAMPIALRRRLRRIPTDQSEHKNSIDATNYHLGILQMLYANLGIRNNGLKIPSIHEQIHSISDLEKFVS